MLLMLHCARDTRLCQRIRCGRRPLGSQALGPPAVLPLVVPQILQIGEHFAAEQVDVLETQVVRHGAEMQKRKEMADAQPLHPFEELIAHGLRASRDEKSALDEVLVPEVPHVEALPQRRLHGAQHAGIVLVSRDRLVVRRRIKELVEEILHMRRILLRLRVGLRYPNELQESEAIGVRIPPPLLDRFPEIVTKAVGVLGAVVAQMTEAVVAVDHELHGRGTAGARDPDRRMRLLHRPRPEIDHGQLVMLAVPGEYLLGTPSLEDELECFPIALALLDRPHRVGDGAISQHAGGEEASPPPPRRGYSQSASILRQCASAGWWRGESSRAG